MNMYRLQKAKEKRGNVSGHFPAEISHIMCPQTCHGNLCT